MSPFLKTILKSDKRTIGNQSFLTQISGAYLCLSSNFYGNIFSLHLPDMTKLCLSILLFCLVFLSCGQTQVSTQTPHKRQAVSSNDTTLNKLLLVDTNRIVILSIDTANVWVFKNATALQLANQDLQTIDSLLTKCIKTNNNREDTTKRFSEFINLKNYKRQYIPFIDEKGEKRVYINCFCLPDYPNEFDYWKKSLVEVDDGGSCFFHLTINLTSKQYGQLFTNGYG